MELDSDTSPPPSPMSSSMEDEYSPPQSPEKKRLKRTNSEATSRAFLTKVTHGQNYRLHAINFECSMTDIKDFKCYIYNNTVINIATK